MNTFTNASMPLKLFGVVLALSALAVVAWTLSWNSGAWAQTADNTYADPQPCGPGASAAFMEEPHEVTTGHFGLFDAYWRAKEPVNTANGSVNTGVLHTNECPPEVTSETVTETDPVTFVTKKVTRITRSARDKGMDIDEAILHVLDTYKVDVVATNAEAADGKLSLEEYPGVRKALGLEETDPVPEGTQVWWLRLDDPDTKDNPDTQEKENDETSDLSLGFSTLLLNDDDWHRTDGDGNPHKPLRYKFLVERYPGDPDAEDKPHFLTYEAPKAGGAVADLLWDSTQPAVEQTDVLMDPGEFRALQWVFTKPGTYVISVELQGYVRKNNPHGENDPQYMNWSAISGNVTETSEVRDYTIQVGDTLKETEPPIFGVNLSVEENSPGGVKVGGPIPVYNADADVLEYKLTGEGSENFTLATSTEPHTVQVVVADGASLDYETKPSYEGLTLSVTDNVDHENNPNPYADDILIVRIDLEDQATGEVKLEVDNENPNVGETVNFFLRYEPREDLRDVEPSSYQWGEHIGGDMWKALAADVAPSAPTWSVSQSSVTSKVYRVAVVLLMGEPAQQVFLNSNEITISWDHYTD